MSGFTYAGIAKGSLAAYWQSVGFFDPWIFSSLQSYGACGLFSYFMDFGLGLMSVGLICYYIYPPIKKEVDTD